MERRDIFNKIGLLHLKWVSLETFWKRNSACNGLKSKETCSLSFSRHHNSFSFRAAFLLLCLLWLFGGADVCRAQMKNITVRVMGVKEGAKKKEPVELAIVYGFFNKKMADAFVKKCENNGYSFPLEDYYDGGTEAEGTDPDGYLEIALPQTGYIVVRKEGYVMSKPTAVGKNLELTITITQTRSLKEVDVKAAGQLRNEPGISISIGKDKYVSHKVWLFEEQNRSNSRMLLTPVVVELETKDTFEIRNPYVKDGKQYHDSQLRRMGYDLKNDKLEPYRVEGYLPERGLDSVMVEFMIHKRSVKNHYMVIGWQRYADFNTVYYRDDSLVIDEGKDIEPMRFLEYDILTDSIQKEERYKRVGRSSMQNANQRLYLNFMTDEARIDPSDSLSWMQLEKLRKDLARYNDVNSGIISAKIYGLASPEGGIEVNRRLCRERAQYVRNEIARSPSLRGVNVDVSADVATWEDVAAELERDSLKEYAAQVRAIVSAVKDTRRQEEQIRKLACFPCIKDTILPRLRIVDFSFQYYTKRVKTPEEVYELYQTDPGYRSGEKEQAYEFYYLFDMVKDPKELEVLAKAAMSAVKDWGGDRPWPLAAYVLARCYLERDTCDIHLLEPYLHWRRIPEYGQMIEGSQGGQRKWYNDAAIVSTHIMMLCKDGEFREAARVAANLLPKQPKYERMNSFLKCLAGNWFEPGVRDTVAASSVWNKAVVYAAQDKRTPGYKMYNDEALELLQDETQIDQNDPRTHYMIAQLRFREVKNVTRKDTVPEKHFVKADVFDPSEIMGPTGYGADLLEEEVPEDWGYPMVQCCLKDSSFLEYLRYDGEFTDAYRRGFKKYWTKFQKRLAALKAAAAAEPEMQTDSTSADTESLPVDSVPQGQSDPVGGGELQQASVPESNEADGNAESSTVPSPVAVPVPTVPENPVPATVPATVPAY